MPNEVLWTLRLIYDRNTSFSLHLACFLALSLSITFLAKADAHTSFCPPRMSSTGQQSVDTRPLELGIPVDRALMSDETHSYQIALAADQYVRVEVAQRGELQCVTGNSLAANNVTVKVR